MEEIDRFITKYTVNGDTGCWEWTASIAGGYGAFHYSRGKRAHRFSYEYHNDTILGDLTIDHLCNNTICVNPDHLEAVTRGENSRRRNLNEYEYKRNEYCKKGHKREYVNKKTGQLDCIICKREALAKYRQNNREKYNEYMRQYYLDNRGKKQ